MSEEPNCPSCGWRSYARIDQQIADGSFAPGPYVRCIQCKRKWMLPLPPPPDAGEVRTYRDIAPPAVRAEPNDDDHRTAVAVLLVLNPSNPDTDMAAKLIAAYRVACLDVAAKVAMDDVPQYDDVAVAAGEARAAIRIAAAIRKLP